MPQTPCCDLASKCSDVGCNKVLLAPIDTLAAWFHSWRCKAAGPNEATASLSDGFLSAFSSLPSNAPVALVSFLHACQQCLQVMSLSPALHFYSSIFVLTNFVITSE